MVPYIFALVLIAIGIYSASTDGWSIESGTPQVLIFGFAMLFAIIYLHSQALKGSNLEQVILENKEKLAGNGEVQYKGATITKNTELRRYFWAMSFVLLCLKSMSAYYVAPKSPVSFGFKFSLISFIFGWWGIPYGPIWTVESLIKNFKGGEQVFVRDLLI